MRRRFASCRRAVVAAETCPGRVRMIEVDRRPVRCNVAILAGVVARYMRWRLARCGCSVVTTGT